MRTTIGFIFKNNYSCNPRAAVISDGDHRNKGEVIRTMATHETTDPISLVNAFCFFFPVAKELLGSLLLAYGEIYISDVEFKS